MVAKKPAAKKTVKKAAPKRAASKKSSKKTEEMRSFRLYKESAPFTKVQVTRQTVYWSILLLFIVILQLWILKVQLEIADATMVLFAQ